MSEDLLDYSELLLNELRVRTYKQLSTQPLAVSGDDLTPHHMPGASTLKNEVPEIPYNSGSSLNVKASVHKLTFTFEKIGIIDYTSCMKFLITKIDWYLIKEMLRTFMKKYGPM